MHTISHGKQVRTHSLHKMHSAYMHARSAHAEASLAEGSEGEPPPGGACAATATLPYSPNFAGPTYRTTSKVVELADVVTSQATPPATPNSRGKYRNKSVAITNK